MKAFFILGLIGFGVAATADEMDKCSTRMGNAAIATFAEERGVSVSSIKLADLEMGAWSEAVGDNYGSASVTAYVASGRTAYAVYNVSAQQIGTTSDCKVLGVEKTELNPSSPKAQSIGYKLIMKDALYMSEGDSEWSLFYTDQAVSEQVTKKELAQVLRTREPIEVYSAKIAEEILADYAGEDSPYSEYRFRYERLLKQLKADFKTLRAIKVGKPDSGELELYIFGRRPDGRLVGLKTIVVET